MRKHFKYLVIAGLASLLALTACGGGEATPQAFLPDATNDTIFTVIGAGEGSGDFSHLRTPYVGAAHATQAVVNALPLPSDDWAVGSIQIGADHGDFAKSYSPYTLTIFYEPQQGRVIAGTRDDLQIPTDAFTANSDLLFDLIENLQAVTFSVRFNHVEDGGANDGFFDYRWSRSRHGEYSLEIGHNREANTTAFAINIDQMSNVNLGFNVLHEVNYNSAFEDIRGFRFDSDGERLVIWASQPIYNLSLVAIGHDVVDDNFGFLVTDTVFTIDRLDSAAAEALVIDSYYGMGTMPWSGISFEDGAGTRRYFTLQQSGYDGRFHLHEFEPMVVFRSELTMVSGVISDMGPHVSWQGDSAETSGSGFFIQIDFVDRNCQYVDGGFVMSGTPGTIELFIESHRTLELANTPLEVGMVVTAFFENSPYLVRRVPMSDRNSIIATAVVCRDYGWVHVARFDDNFLSCDGFYSLAILDDAIITYQDGTPFEGDVSELANRLLAVYVAMSGSPTPDGPMIHGIAASRVVILS